MLFLHTSGLGCGGWLGCQSCWPCASSSGQLTNRLRYSALLPGPPTPPSYPTPPHLHTPRQADELLEALAQGSTAGLLQALHTSLLRLVQADMGVLFGPLLCFLLCFAAG